MIRNVIKKCPRYHIKEKDTEIVDLYFLNAETLQM